MLISLEDTAHYVVFLLAPDEDFGLSAKVCFALRAKKGSMWLNLFEVTFVVG